VHQRHVETLFSTLYGDASLWELPNPNYVTLSPRFASMANQCHEGLAGTAAGSPTVVAFTTTAECDVIYAAHSLHSLLLYPAEYTNITALDGMLVGLIGDNPASSILVAFSQGFLTMSRVIAALDIANLLSATHHGAVPPTFHSWPYVNTEAGVTEISARSAMILPYELAGLALRQAQVDGRYSLLSFVSMFLQPALAGPAPNRAHIEPLVNWCFDQHGR
jgi:hypothetical protein